MSHTFDAAYVRGLKTETGMTTQQIAEASHVPQGTVSHILNGETQNPTFANVADIVYALGGSLDAMTGRNDRSSTLKEINLGYESIMEKALDSSRQSYNNAYSKAMETNAHEQEVLRAIIHAKDNWLRRMFAYSCVLTAILIAVLIIGNQI